MNLLSPFEGLARVLRPRMRIVTLYYTSSENIVMLKSDLRFESIVSYNINFPGSTFYFFQLPHLYIMAKRIGGNRLRVRVLVIKVK